MDINKVKDWWVEEMKYDKEPPADDDLRMICSAGMQSVWSHLLENCRSLENVKKIKGNLAIAKKRQATMDISKSMSMSISVSDGGERDELLAERSRIKSQLHETISKIERLKVGLKSVEEERRSVHKNKEEYMRTIQSKRLSSALLALYAKKVENMKKEIETMDKAHVKIEENLKKKEKSAKEERVYSVGSAVESEGDRRLRIIMDKAVAHMQSVVDGANTGTRKDLRTEIVGLLDEISSSSLERALVKSLHNQIDHVNELRKSLNLIEEAKSLKLEGGIEADGGIVSSVKEEVNNLYLKHIKANEDLQKAKKAVLNHGTELSALLEANSENISSMKELEAGMGAAGDAAILEYKKGEVRALQEHLFELAGRKENQQQIINWVKGAENKIQEMTEIISALINSNLQGKQKLVCRQTVAEELRNELPAVLKGLNRSLDRARDGPSVMLQSFTQVPVDRFCSTMVEGKHETTLIPSPDLGIYRMRECYPYPSQVGDLNSERLTVSQTSRQDLPAQFSALIAEVQQLKKQLQDLERSESESLLPSLRQLLEKLKQSKLQQVKDFLPLLRNTEACSKDGMAVCDRVEVGLQEWTNQGAQGVVGRESERVVEGRTLAQWQDALRVATANTKS